MRRKPKGDLQPPGQLTPPEGVPLGFEVAGVGVRMGAQIVDVLITFVAAISIVVLLSAMDVLSGRNATALASLIFFLIRVPYYVVSELAWNGQTL
ncbi:MAG: RDD family protein, partial [Pseudomonadota bacterium]